MSDWAERELLEFIRIIGPQANEDSVTQLMRMNAIRRMIEADSDKYLALLAKHSSKESA